MVQFFVGVVCGIVIGAIITMTLFALLYLRGDEPDDLS